MSLRWRDRRRQLFGRGAAPAEARAARRRERVLPRRPPLAWTPLVAVAVISLLGLAALRISILRTRYTLGAELEREVELRERERSLLVEIRQGLDPRRLRESAHDLGFARPERVIDLARGKNAR